MICHLSEGFTLFCGLILFPALFCIFIVCSVHGTWVCGERATPQVPLTLGQNDTFKLGASSRVYTVQWVPFSSTILEEEVTTYPIMENSHRALTQKEVQVRYSDSPPDFENLV